MVLNSAPDIGCQQPASAIVRIVSILEDRTKVKELRFISMHMTGEKLLRGV